MRIDNDRIDRCDSAQNPIRSEWVALGGNVGVAFRSRTATGGVSYLKEPRHGHWQDLQLSVIDVRAGCEADSLISSPLKPEKDSGTEDEVIEAHTR
jgi:hypothetical protein